MLPELPAVGRALWRLRTRRWIGQLADLIFPPSCAGCGKEGHRFCEACQASISYLSPPLCARCGYPCQRAGPGSCVNCRRLELPGLAGIRSAAFFDGPLQSALHRLKYKRDMLLADSLADLLEQARQQAALPGDLVIPVPLSARRLRERGYNQAGLLARGLADLAGLPCAPSGLARVRQTRSQVGLSAADRARNVVGAFRARPAMVAGRAVLLVDDVCTTGATLAAGALALRAAGAAQVWGLTVARAR